VLGGMLAATSLAIFVVPVLYVAITRLAYGKKGLEELKKKAEKNKQEEKPEEQPQLVDK